ncbi:MAG: hypothetical protein SFU56_20415 [Capsulimonadales bacterium]|nr:hypothetical protein [Capsulimonadales bacterium]
MPYLRRSFSRFSPRRFAYDTAGIRIENLNAVGVGRDNGNLKDGISFFSDIPIVGNKLDTVQIHNVEVSGFGVNGVSIGAYVYDYENYVAIKTGFKNVRITNVVAHDNGDGGIYTYGSFNSYYGPDFPESLIPGYSHENVYVGGCCAYRNTGFANKGNNSGNGIVLSDVENGMIECSVAFENGAKNDHKGGGPVGIWAWESKNVVIRFNESYRNRSMTIDGGGFDLDGGCVNCVMEYNYSHDNFGSGFLVYEFYSARPMRNNKVRYNLSVNDGISNGGGFTFGGGMDGLLVEGNTFIFGNNPLPTAEGPFGVLQVKDGMTNVNVTIRRNLFIPQGNRTMIKVPDLALQPNLLFRDNCYLTPFFHAIWGATEYDSLNAWRSATGQEP